MPAMITYEELQELLQRLDESDEGVAICPKCLSIENDREYGYCHCDNDD